MRMLSKGRTKVAVLTVKPANVANPTVSELNAGIPNAADFIPSALWTFRAGDPSTEDDSPLSKQFTAQVPNEATYDLNMGVYRGFAANGDFDPTEDALFQATRVMGTTLWVYARKSGKLSSAAWANGDEFYLGGEVMTSNPKEVDTGNIKYEVPLFPQDMFEFGSVGAATAPTVSSLSPTGGVAAGGTSVLITGNGFVGVTGVKFASTDATNYNVVNGHQIVATAPAHAAGQVDVTVVTGAGTSGTSAATKFLYA